MLTTTSMYLGLNSQPGENNLGMFSFTQQRIRTGYESSSCDFGSLAEGQQSFKCMCMLSGGEAALYGCTNVVCVCVCVNSCFK